jgi:hypothetical protein
MAVLSTEPAWNWGVSWSFDIFGPTVEFAAYDPIIKQVLVGYTNGTFQIVQNVQSFNQNEANEAAVLALVAAFG